jgi:transcriptional regulator with XRE-family HTH domain
MAGTARTAPANHLRAWREFRKMTQQALGEAAGTTGNVISQLESGERGLSHKWLVRLAPILETTPGFLLDHKPEDLDSDYVRTALGIPMANRPHVLEILRTFSARR